ncbi:MAG: ARMT1-like domain-containing protein [Sulfurospirillaceae bacterium]|nr:ARMT1-like domain-containing protein [Sulfurospirillaceae bacterium]MDD2827641.1 ARMT1-like domain-containing protein [Sulfurospirillaceae bacterium]
MKIHNDCLECIENQAHRVCDILSLDIKTREAIISLTQKHIAQFDFSLTPPHNATPLYESIANHLNVRDLYADVKKESSKKAKSFISLCEDEIAKSSYPLLSATKTAVAGNVIDLASVMMYDLEEELHKIYDMPFAIDDFTALEKSLHASKKIVYLADNAGEEIFDKLYIQTLRKLFPSLKIYYFVRGKPIINDLTYEDALKSGMNEVAEIVNSGVPTPGLTRELMCDEAKHIFEQADCIISKGMGNYECLGEEKRLPIFFLLKVKCHVVANAIGAQLGDIVCKQGFK